MADLIRRVSSPGAADDPEKLLASEWLVTNGLGGYASGTVAGVPTRRYHGFLVAALPAPLGRFVMLNHLATEIRRPDGRLVGLDCLERAGALDLAGVRHLAEFRLESGLPVWLYEIDNWAIEKRIVLPHCQNTVVIQFSLIAGTGPVRLRLRPSLHFRPHEGAVDDPLVRPYVLTAVEDRLEIAAGPAIPPLRLAIDGAHAAFTIAGRMVPEVWYRVEAGRGYPASGDLWTPGRFGADLTPDRPVTLTASTEPWESIRALPPDLAFGSERERRRRLIEAAPPEARAGIAAELVLAADQFLITPAGRVEDATRARASGDEVRTVIAGYHWFTDWGRDTMISLEGLTLATGRPADAGYILRTFAEHVRDGLIPNLFPEGRTEGLYHTADATLWFFHAVERYLRATGDRGTLELLLPILREIVACHQRGTRFGIGVDPADGLLRQGAPGYQLTWMDAKVDDWVVTPRRGKAVEINALWYNVLRLLESWLRQTGDDAGAAAIGAAAAQAATSFNERFWYAEGGYLYDLVDGETGDDPACRPNQIFAVALDHPVLDRDRWQPVVETVRNRLLTPVGLRSLSPDHRDYQRTYAGDPRSRDAAYHQGTVWAWLIGPFVDAWLRVYPADQAGARRILAGFDEHLSQACVGSISEIFDAEPPYMPRGCVAQAWSVAEVLRVWLRLSSEPQIADIAIATRPVT